MAKYLALLAYLVLLVSCIDHPASSTSRPPSVIVVTNPPTLTVDEVMPMLKTITPENASTIQLLRTLQIPGYTRGRVSQCNTAFSPDGALVLGVCGKNPVAVWDVQSGQLRYTFGPSGVQLVN